MFSHKIEIPFYLYRYLFALKKKKPSHASTNMNCTYIYIKGDIKDQQIADFVYLPPLKRGGEN